MVDSVRFCVPTIGDTIQLAESWKFTLHGEYRNSKFYESLRAYAPDCLEDDNVQDVSSYSMRGYTTVTLPKGTILKVNRIYIRQGKSDYDSITFTIAKKNVPELPKLSGRFWAKLRDVNSIICLPIGEESAALFGQPKMTGRILDL